MLVTLVKRPRVDPLSQKSVTTIMGILAGPPPKATPPQE